MWIFKSAKDVMLDQQSQKKRNQFLAAMYSTYPGAFTELRHTLSELSSMARTNAENKNHDLMSRALSTITELLTLYLELRDGNLVMPTSVQAMFGITDMTFDAVLIDQLETLSVVARICISQRDIQATAEAMSTFERLGIASLKFATLHEDPGTNPTTTVIIGYLHGVTQHAAVETFDDGWLAGLRALGNIGKHAASKNLYLTLQTLVGRFRDYCILGIARGSTLIVAEAFARLMELLQAVVVAADLAGSHTVDTILDAAKEVTLADAQLAQSTVMGAQDLQQRVGSFLSLTSGTSIAYIYDLCATRYLSALKHSHFNVASRYRHYLQELNEWIAWNMAQIGSEAAKRNSFLIYMVNSTTAHILTTQLDLSSRIKDLKLVGEGEEFWREDHLKNEFREKLLDAFSTYLIQLYTAMCEGFVQGIGAARTWEISRTLSFLGIRCVELGLSEQAASVISQLEKLSTAFIEKPISESAYDAPRTAEYIARIGIVAMMSNAPETLNASIEALKRVQIAYKSKLDSSEELSLENRRELQSRLIHEVEELSRRWHEGSHFIIPEEGYFFSRISPNDIEKFRDLLISSLGPDLS